MKNFRFLFAMLLISCLIATCKEQPTESEDSVIIDKILIEEGTFWMVIPLKDGNLDQMPAHTVYVSSFYLSRFEITQLEYQTIMGHNPSPTIHPLPLSVQASVSHKQHD